MRGLIHRLAPRLACRRWSDLYPLQSFFPDDGWRHALIFRLLLFLPPCMLAAASGASVVVTTRPAFQVDHRSPTADKPQSKLWFAGGVWWALLPGAKSPTLWQRTDQGWVEHAALRTQLAGVPGRADVWFDRTGATAVSVDGSTLAIIRFHPIGVPVKNWRAERLAQWTAPSKEPIETVTIARDGVGRWWVAAPITASPDSFIPPGAESPVPARPRYGPPRDIVVWTSTDAVSWQRLAPLARGISGDDLCTVTPAPGGIGVAWSDQTRDHVAFVRHRDGAPPSEWDPVEIVAAGSKTADDHLHAAMTPDGTVWLATKNSVDQRNQPQLVLRLRPPQGGWLNLAYAPREQGIEPSRPVVAATSDPAVVVLGHTVYDLSHPFQGRIVFGRVDRSDARVIPNATVVIAPDPALRSRINDITMPKAPYPTDAPWIALASDTEGRVFETDLRRLAATPAVP